MCAVRVTQVFEKAQQLSRAGDRPIGPSAEAGRQPRDHVLALHEVQQRLLVGH